MQEMLWTQPGFIYSTCGTFTKNKPRIQKFKEARQVRYIYQKELNKAFFEHHLVQKNNI